MAEPKPLLIPADIHALMISHCLRAAPLECCGILGGIAPLVSSIHILKNIEASETRYDADPRDIIEANRILRERNAEYLALYHSHPRWAAIPSRADLEQNYYGPTPRIIVSLLDDPPVVRVWRLAKKSYRELPWRVVPTGDEAEWRRG